MHVLYTHNLNDCESTHSTKLLCAATNAQTKCALVAALFIDLI